MFEADAARKKGVQIAGEEDWRSSIESRIQRRLQRLGVKAALAIVSNNASAGVNRCACILWSCVTSTWARANSVRPSSPGNCNRREEIAMGNLEACFNNTPSAVKMRRGIQANLGPSALAACATFGTRI